MANDVILNSIYTTMVGLGYTVKVETLPAIREWDVTPLVLLVPQGKNGIIADAMGSSGFSTNVIHNYLLVYISQNELNVNVPDVVNTFKSNVINQFRGLNAPLASIAGTWECDVDDNVEFDESLVKEGYNYSAINIIVQRIFQGVV